MEKEYYVYVLLDTRESGKWGYNGISLNYKPFYFGKGKNKRIEEHYRPSSLKQNNLKNKIINRVILDTGNKPIGVKLFENLTEEEALTKEKELISYFGRIDKATGILANHTDGGEGHSGYNKPKFYNRKPIYQYDLNGGLLKKWTYITEAANELKLVHGNISTAIKRNGTCGGFIWSYDENFILPKIKYQMPIKYTNIKQIDKKTNELIKTFNNAGEVETELNLRVGSRNKIIDCINGKIKTAYGYKWEK
jgi:hypothetical protein